MWNSQVGLFVKKRWKWIALAGVTVATAFYVHDDWRQYLSAIRTDLSDRFLMARQHKRRETLFESVSGVVLELGAGTGVNTRFIRHDMQEYTGVNNTFNPFIEQKLQTTSDYYSVGNTTLWSPLPSSSPSPLQSEVVNSSSLPTVFPSPAPVPFSSMPVPPLTPQQAKVMARLKRKLPGKSASSSKGARSSSNSSSSSSSPHSGIIAFLKAQPSNSYDCVVGNHVFCSIPDYEEAIREVYRVLKPEGRFYFIEHSLSSNPLKKLLQIILNPFYRTLTCHGCSLTHKSDKVIEQVFDGSIEKSMWSKRPDYKRRSYVLRYLYNRSGIFRPFQGGIATKKNPTPSPMIASSPSPIVRADPLAAKAAITAFANKLGDTKAAKS
eukprot:TRINITY_DN3834_c0_g1_i1.p1 TRINITY_DN3834_c0_g1~~TRINITY_DN3834_c0_g1_i1.p1  ORF type:complete len:390 (+),score=63.45 TRINITY_DN3834_c0_g1_i1:33-1172(+)